MGAKRVVGSFPSAIAPNTHPYLNGAWTPNLVEWDDDSLEVIEGHVPNDIDGVYLRNTENPIHEPIGRYHPFDGDGHVHAVIFKEGRARYRNRFVRTDGFEAEQQEGQALWAGLAENPQKSKRPGWGAQGSLKDSSSTDVVVHAGRALTTFYQCGEAYRLDLESLETVGKAPWVPPGDGISAHCKVDDETGELFFFNYSKEPPYLHYGHVDGSDRLQHYQGVLLPGPRLPHDMGLSKRHAVLCDFPLFWDPKLLRKGVHANRFYPELPSRFGVLPREGGAVRWFEASPTFVLHFLNCWEEGDEVVLDGYRQRNPMPSATHPAAPNAPRGHERMMVYLDMHAMQPRLHRWRFNMTTGETRELELDPDRVLEFGTFNPRRLGRPYRYVYSLASRPGWFLFTRITKTDLTTGKVQSFDFGEERYGSEAPFIRREGAEDANEDDGYLVTLVTDMRMDCSECLLLDAKDITKGPVVRLRLPHRISSGTHATWWDRSKRSDGATQSQRQLAARL